MAEPANPTGPFTTGERFQIFSQMLLQIRGVGMQQSLIEITLDKSTRRNVERFANVPSMIDTDAGKLSASEERMTQVRGLRSFRVIADTLSVAAGNALQLRQNFGLEHCRRQLARGRIENHDDFGAIIKLQFN